MTKRLCVTLLLTMGLAGISTGTEPVVRDVAFTADIDRSEQRYVELLPPKFNADEPTDILIALPGRDSLAVVRLPLLAVVAGSHAQFTAEDFVHSHGLAEPDFAGDFGQRTLAAGEFAFRSLDAHAPDFADDCALQMLAESPLQRAGFCLHGSRNIVRGN